MQILIIPFISSLVTSVPLGALPFGLVDLEVAEDINTVQDHLFMIPKLPSISTFPFDLREEVAACYPTEGFRSLVVGRGGGVSGWRSWKLSAA